MRTMDALSLRYNSSHSTDRAQACAGDSHASSGIDVACPTTQRVLAIASPHESPEDSWPPSSTGTGTFHRNQQYSVTAITTSTGTIAERYAYTAYGQPTILDASASVLSASAISNRYTYAGREWDATLGLQHFRARRMSPSAGRFLGRDPIKYRKQDVHLYEFVSSSPSRKTDPFGLFAPDDDKTIDDYLEEWFEQSIFQNSRNKAATLAVLKRMLNIGCRGVVTVQLGYFNLEWLKTQTYCYSTFERIWSRFET